MQPRIDQIFKKNLVGLVSNLIYFIHYSYVHSSIARNLMIRLTDYWSEKTFSCVISQHSQPKADGEKADQRVLKNFYTRTWQ